MDTLELKFATPHPVPFKEKDCEGVFEARMYGEAVVTGMEAAPGEENVTTYLRDLINEQIIKALADWDPERRVVTDDICEIMGQKLEERLAKKGITAKIRIVNFYMLEESDKRHYEQILKLDAMKHLGLQPAEPIRLEPVRHGRLTGCGYHATPAA